MSIKTLIVDDSATVRHVVGGILEQASGIEVIGTASDPLFAMKKNGQGMARGHRVGHRDATHGWIDLFKKNYAGKTNPGGNLLDSDNRRFVHGVTGAELRRCRGSR